MVIFEHKRQLHSLWMLLHEFKTPQDKVGRWITTWLHFFFRESCFKPTCKSSSLPASYSATGHTSPRVVKTLLSSSHLGLGDSEGDSLRVKTYWWNLRVGYARLGGTVNTRIKITYSKYLFLDLHMQKDLPGLLFLAKKVVMQGQIQKNRKGGIDARKACPIGLVWRSRPFTFLLWAESGRKGSGESSTPDLCCAKIVARQSDCSICN